MTFEPGSPELTIATGTIIIAGLVFFADLLEQIGETSDVKGAPRLADALALLRAGFKIAAATLVVWVAMVTFKWDPTTTFWIAWGCTMALLIGIGVVTKILRYRSSKTPVVTVPAVDTTPGNGSTVVVVNPVGGTAPKPTTAPGSVLIGVLGALLFVNAVLAGLVYKAGQRTDRSASR
jgi:hypothetical protein